MALAGAVAPNTACKPVNPAPGTRMSPAPKRPSSRRPRSAWEQKRRPAQARCGDVLKKVRVVQGKANEPRTLTPTYDDSLPKDHSTNLYLWIQDGSANRRKSVIAEARARGADNPTLFAFLPAQHKTELTNAIIALEAAPTRLFLAKKGPPGHRRRPRRPALHGKPPAPRRTWPTCSTS